MQMIDLPTAYENAARTRFLQNQVADQDQNRVLAQTYNRFMNPQTGALDTQGFRAAAQARGAGLKANQMIFQMTEAQRKQLTEHLDEVGAHVRGLADQYEADVKEDPRTAKQKLQMNYSKLVASDPESYAAMQQGKLPKPEEVSYDMLVGIMGKHADAYETIKAARARAAQQDKYREEQLGVQRERNEIMRKGLEKKGVTAKTIQENKTVAAIAKEHGLTESEVRSVMGTNKTMGTEAFDTLLKDKYPALMKKYSKHLLESGGGTAGDRTPTQQNAFATLRKNPKNQSYSDEELWQAIEEKGIK